MNKQKLLDFLHKEYDEVDAIMVTQFETKAIWDMSTNESLFEIDKNPFKDPEVALSHEFDLGKYKTLEQLIKDIEDGKFD